MNTKSVTETAVKNLSLKRIVVRSSTAQINERFQFQLDQWTTKNHLKQSASSPVDIRVSKENDKTIYIFGYLLGTRIVCKENPDEVIFACETTFDAIYQSKKELDEAFLDSFHKKHVQYHITPYWREFLQNSTLRADVPILSVPFYTLENIDKIDK